MAYLPYEEDVTDAITVTNGSANSQVREIGDSKQSLKVNSSRVASVLSARIGPESDAHRSASHVTVILSKWGKRESLHRIKRRFALSPLCEKVRQATLELRND